ncbi:GH1 family beta-glucosidase [Aquiluna sp. KACHI24]|uniref:GH1 family beta-glucosidase n=1 Tax=Aquiluna sp. KACHI24 TaxID=2968831 RepID=UPI00220BD0ED|nr:GH1 family beta-glucosidase [Aquiluna sp. KACHI24]BDQ00042.1 beta-glucosidase [Aquiluna sp. KACHI24]
MTTSFEAAPLAKRLPQGFVLGAATASWQIEGDSAGRGRSIWDDFADVPGNIKDGTKADPACDHVNRLESDLDLLKSLGLDAYRFSVSWPRVMPGAKTASEQGLDFYDRLIDGLLERDIMPALTLYHWDLPSELQAIGGWTNPEIHKYFADYATLLGEKFADRVERWATLNEPWVSAFLGYATKIHAPGLGNPAAGLEAAYRLMTAHASGAVALRAAGAKNVGTVLNLTTAISDDPKVDHIADYVDLLQNRFWLDLLAGRGIDPLLVERTKQFTDWSFVSDQQLAQISKPIDWLGINYYTPFRVVPVSTEGGAWAVGQDFSLFPGTPAGGQMAPREPRTEMGWEIHPQSMTTTLQQTASRLPGVPLYITENGGAFPDNLVDGKVDDQDRISYYHSHISAVADAVDAGVDVRGYFAWSLMDNIEWAEGLTKRFGIVHVDYETMRRTPKASAEFLSALAKAR